jgi:hypothetical protein
MSIDLSNKTVFPLSEAAKRLPPNRRGRPVTLSCVLRWVLDGVRTRDRKVRLEAVRLGGRWLTSKEAIQRFAEQLTPRFEDAPAAMPRSPAARRRASERAAKELEAARI